MFQYGTINKIINEPRAIDKGLYQNGIGIIVRQPEQHWNSEFVDMIEQNSSRSVELNVCWKSASTWFWNGCTPVSPVQFKSKTVGILMQIWYIESLTWILMGEGVIFSQSASTWKWWSLEQHPKLIMLPQRNNAHIAKSKPMLKQLHRTKTPTPAQFNL